MKKVVQRTTEAAQSDAERSVQERNMVIFNRKKFRFSDWFAEKIIKGVAFLSIGVVILIFIFVFREAFPIFHMDKNKTDSPAEVLVQESYGGAAEGIPSRC